MESKTNSESYLNFVNRTFILKYNLVNYLIFKTIRLEIKSLSIYFSNN
jgi:hypothetical protein